MAHFIKSLYTLGWSLIIHTHMHIWFTYLFRFQELNIGPCSCQADICATELYILGPILKIMSQIYRNGAILTHNIEVIARILHSQVLL